MTDLPGSVRPALSPVLLLAVALCLVLVSCGDESDSPAQSPTPVPAESVDRPAKLPARWTLVTNQAAGFTIGLPPGWEERPQEGGQGTILASPDRLAAVTVSADRSAGALALPPGEFATRTAEALAGAEAGRGGLREVELDPARPLDHPYEGALVAGAGISASGGIRERIEVAVLRRPELAVYVLVARSNAEAESDFLDSETIAEIIAGLRGRPPA